jgi:hypothetical protein
LAASGGTWGREGGLGLLVSNKMEHFFGEVVHELAVVAVLAA